MAPLIITLQNSKVMALAQFHSERGTKSALILVKANKFCMSWSPAYVPRTACEGMTQGDAFSIPDGFKLVPIVDSTTGEVRTAKDGSVLHQLAW